MKTCPECGHGRGFHYTSVCSGLGNFSRCRFVMAILPEKTDGSFVLNCPCQHPNGLLIGNESEHGGIADILEGSPASEWDTK